jgi:ketosteroid isomerase-like protein
MPLRLHSRSRRTFGQRLALRSPGLASRALAPVLRRGPSSRLRRTLLPRFVRQSYEAVNRGDFEAAIAMAPGDYELHIAQDGVGPGAGVRDVYRGREGLLQAVEDFVSAFEQFRYEPQELIDLGEQFVVLLHMVGRGRGSGVETRQTLAIVYELENGLMVRERHYWDWANALDAVALQE